MKKKQLKRIRMNNLVLIRSHVRLTNTVAKIRDVYIMRDLESKDKNALTVTLQRGITNRWGKEVLQIHTLVDFSIASLDMLIHGLNNYNYNCTYMSRDDYWNSIHDVTTSHHKHVCESGDADNITIVRFYLNTILSQYKDMDSTSNYTVTLNMPASLSMGGTLSFMGDFSE